MVDAEELPLPAKVVTQDARTTRVHFGGLSLAQEDDLVRVLYGRANAWNTWSADVPKDKPLLVHCNSGARSAAAVGLLEGRGFTAIDVDDLFANYRESGAAGRS